MLRSLVPLLTCPTCTDSPIQYLNEDSSNESENGGGEIVGGVLRCERCAASYPINDGIPRLLPARMLAAQEDEIAARDAQVDQYDANTFLNVFGRWEIPATLRRLRVKATDTLLEGGCGTGRMTRILAAQAQAVVAIDFSLASLAANKRKLEAAGVRNVHLVQADLCHLPFASERFDRVVSCQVLEHVPGQEAREEAVSALARVARPGARLVLSAYRYSRLMGVKEGRHDGGIPFFRFTRDEFRALLSTKLRVSSITGMLVYLYLAQCDKSRSGG